MPSFITNAVQVQRFADALYNVAVGTSTMAQVTADITASGGLDNALNAYYSSSFTGVPTATVAANMCTNLGIVAGQNGLVAADVTVAQNYIVGTLNAAPANARGAAVKGILNNLSALTSDKVFGAVATKFNKDIDNATAYTGTTDIAAGTAAAPVVVNTFVLTTGSNTFTGSSGADTFDGGLSSSNLQTFNSGDRLFGGDGNDELIAVVSSSVTPTAMTSIETATITNTGAASVLDFSNATGLTTLVSQGATGALTTLQGISKSVNVSIQDTTLAHTVGYSDVTGSADSATITLRNVTTPAGGVAPIMTAAGVETITLNSTGSVDNVISAPAFAAATSMLVTGTVGLNIGTLATSSTAIRSLDASAHAPTTKIGVTVTMGSASATTVIGGSGNDTITMGASSGADSVSTGDGNDLITFSANFTTADTVNGGDGTTDELRLTEANFQTASATTPTTYTVTNIERISVSTALATATTYNPTNISATATTLNVRGAKDTAITAGNNTITGPAGAFTLGLGQASTTAALDNDAGILGANTLTIADTGTGITDTVTVNNSATDASAQINVYNGSAITSNGYETLILNTGSTASSVYNSFGVITVTGDVGGTSAETVRFTGANPVNATAIIDADIIDASALTFVGTGVTNTTATFFMAAVAHTATNITGSAGPDNLVSAVASSSVDGGAGNDSITGGAGNDTLIGGDGADTLIGAAGNDSITGNAGNDSVTAGGGNDTILGGDGNDNINLEGNLAAGDSLVGGDGTDTLLLTRSTTSPTAAASVSVSGFENLRLDGADGAAATAVTLTNFVNNAFTRLNNNVSGSGAVAYSSAQDSLGTLGLQNTTAHTGSITLTRLVDGPANTLAIAIGDTASTAAAGIAETAVTVNDEEFLTITSSGFATGNAITTLSATDAISITLTGTRELTIGTLTALDVLTTLNASAFTGALSVGATAVTNSANMTITGPTSVPATISGGQGNDTINAGIGNDSLLGGDGNDSITAGAGNDTVIGGAGTDILIGGDGTDTISAVGMNAALIDGTTATSTGAVINMGASSLSATSIATLLGAGTAATAVAGISSNLSSVASGQAAYIYANTTTSGSSSVDTLSGFENIVGSSGTDYLIGNSSANTITGGLGRDVMTGGSGIDTFVYGASVGNLVNYAGTDTTAVNIERITDFLVGTDVIQLTAGTTFAGIAVVATTGVTVAAPAAIASAATLTLLAAQAALAQVEVASTAGAAAAATGLQAYVYTVAGTLGTLFEGRTYLVINNGDATIGADDVWIDITGVSGTLTGSGAGGGFTVV